MATTLTTEQKQSAAHFTETQARVAAAFIASCFIPDEAWGNAEERDSLKIRIYESLSEKVIQAVRDAQRFGPCPLTNPREIGLSYSTDYGLPSAIIHEAIREAGYDHGLHSKSFGPVKTVAVNLTVTGDVWAFVTDAAPIKMYSIADGVNLQIGSSWHGIVTSAYKSGRQDTPETAGQPDYILT